MSRVLTDQVNYAEWKGTSLTKSRREGDKIRTSAKKWEGLVREGRHPPDVTTTKHVSLSVEFEVAGVMQHIPPVRVGPVLSFLRGSLGVQDARCSPLQLLSVCLHIAVGITNQFLQFFWVALIKLYG